ncbi:hypothetical protein [Microbacterium sp. NPDC078849]|uniref:hypothetical protein n=1 Tax=unclassified Microbacterium TaxID=2609290 RepID=UPI00344C96B3
MSGQTYFERDEERIARAVVRGDCAEPGPWATVCTEDPRHRYSHYDAHDDSPWQDDWRENGPDEDEEGESRG